MASNTTDLKVAVEEGTSWSRRLSITVPAERVSEARKKIANQIAQRARMPGFRQGKLPASVVEQRFGPSIDQETIDRLIQETFREALEAEGIQPINQGRVDEIEYNKGEEFSYQVEVEIRPEIELERLSGFTVSRTPVEVGDEEVDSVLDRLLGERAEWEPIDEGARPDYGDKAMVEITALDENGEATEEPRSYRLELGESQAIPDVEAAILTLAPGEGGEFEVTFPEDFPDEERRGEKQKLRIDVKEAQKKVLPELNDEFAKSIGEFESVDELRERILKDLNEDAENRSESDVRRQLIDNIIESNPFDPPTSMVDRYLDYMLDGGASDRKPKQERTPEEAERFGKVREGFRPQAEWALKRTMIVEKLAEAEGLTATQDEIDEKVEEIATRHERSPAEVWIQLEKSGQLAELEREITEEKVFDFLKGENTVA